MQYSVVKMHHLIKKSFNNHYSIIKDLVKNKKSY